MPQTLGLIFVALILSVGASFAEPTVVIGKMETRTHWITLKQSDLGILYTVEAKKQGALEVQAVDLKLEELRVRRPEIFKIIQQAVARPSEFKKSYLDANP